MGEKVHAPRRAAGSGEQVVEARVARRALQALDAAEAAVIEEHDDELEPQANGGGNLAVEHEVRPITHQHDHFPLWLRELHSERTRDLVAHARVTVLEVITTGLRRPPVLVQLPGQAARRAYDDVRLLRGTLHGTDDAGVGGER